MNRPQHKALGPFDQIDHKQVRDEFDTFRKTSLYPEEFPGLAPINQSPDPDRHFAILKKNVSVERIKRDFKKVPCHTCGHDKFFYSGYLVLDEFGFLFLIGPDCGKHFKGNRFQDAEEKFDRQEAERRANEYFAHNCETAHEYALYGRALASRVADARKIYEDLHFNKPALVNLRTALRKHDGILEVVDLEIEYLPSGDIVENPVFVRVAKIGGKAAVDTKFRLDDHLGTISKVLEPFGETTETAWAHIEEAHNKSALPELHSEFLEAVRSLIELRKGLNDFATFFSEANFRQIETWSSDGRNNQSIEVICKGNERALTHQGARKRKFIEITPLLEPLPDVPKGI